MGFYRGGFSRFKKKGAKNKAKDINKCDEKDKIDDKLND